MEQDPSLNDVIIDWLADYTHFICDQFNFPHDEAKGLLQRYLDLTAKDSPQQTVTLPLNQATIYPEIPSPHHETPFRKQGLNAHLSTQPSNLPLGDSVPSKSHRETRLWEDAGFLGSTVPNTTPPGQLTPYGQQPGNVVTTASDLSEASAPYPQQNQRSNQTPIGTVADYDPLWVQKNNVIPLRVHEFRSAMKLETLITAGVVKMGDVLTFQVSVPKNGQVLETEAHLAIIGSSRRLPRCQYFPDLSITLLSDPDKQYPLATACKGTQDMIAHLQTCNITVLKSNWHSIEVFRGQQALGTLWWVKQAFHLWRDDKDNQANETGQYFRSRRANGKGEGIQQHRGVFGVWQHGVFVPDPNQARFRVRG